MNESSEKKKILEKRKKMAHFPEANNSSVTLGKSVESESSSTVLRRSSDPSSIRLETLRSSRELFKSSVDRLGANVKSTGLRTRGDPHGETYKIKLN